MIFLLPALLSAVASAEPPPGLLPWYAAQAPAYDPPTRRFGPRTWIDTAAGSHHVDLVATEPDGLVGWSYVPEGPEILYYPVSDLHTIRIARKKPVLRSAGIGAAIGAGVPLAAGVALELGQAGSCSGTCGLGLGLGAVFAVPGTLIGTAVGAVVGLAAPRELRLDIQGDPHAFEDARPTLRRHSRVQVEAR